MIEYMCVVFAFIIILWLYQELERSGYWSKIEPHVTESPKNLSKSLTVFYKYHVGAYSGAMTIINEARKLFAAPESVTAFGIYYDNPDRVDARYLQSAVGVVVGVDDEELYGEEVTRALSKSGFEKMVMPTSARVVQTTQQCKPGTLSILMLVFRTYGIVKKYIAANRLDVKYAVEFYSPSEISIEFPLEDADDFLVPDYVPTDELESKLARKKFDSDEEDSESEIEVDDEEPASSTE